MKKSWLIILGAVVVLAGIGTVAVLAGKKGGEKDKTNESSSSHTPHEHGAAGHLGKREACDYFKQADADQLMGTGAQKGNLNAGASSVDIHVSSCTYTSKAGSLEEVRNMRTTSLLVRAPLTETGAESNETPFQTRPEGVEDVSGYGDKGYWDPSMGQLNVLKDNIWLIFSNGKARASDRTLDETKKLADVVLPRL